MFCSVFSAKKMSKNAECTHAAVHTLQLCFLFSSSFQFFIVSRREREKKKKRKTIGRLSVFFTQKKDFGIWFCDLSCNLNNKNTIQCIQFLSYLQKSSHQRVLETTLSWNSYQKTIHLCYLYNYQFNKATTSKMLMTL